MRPLPPWECQTCRNLDDDLRESAQLFKASYHYDATISRNDILHILLLLFNDKLINYQVFFEVLKIYVYLVSSEADIWTFSKSKYYTN